MSGRRIVILIFAGVLLVVVVTMALYFLTRQIEEEPAAPATLKAVAIAITIKV